MDSGMLRSRTVPSSLGCCAKLLCMPVWQAHCDGINAAHIVCWCTKCCYTLTMLQRHDRAKLSKLLCKFLCMPVSRPRVPALTKTWP